MVSKDHTEYALLEYLDSTTVSCLFRPAAEGLKHRLQPDGWYCLTVFSMVHSTTQEGGRFLLGPEILG